MFSVFINQLEKKKNSINLEDLFEIMKEQSDPLRKESLVRERA